MVTKPFHLYFFIKYVPTLCSLFTKTCLKTFFKNRHFNALRQKRVKFFLAKNFVILSHNNFFCTKFHMTFCFTWNNIDTFKRPFHVKHLFMKNKRVFHVELLFSINACFNKFICFLYFQSKKPQKLRVFNGFLWFLS